MGLLKAGEDTSQQLVLDRLLEAGWLPLQEGKHIWFWTARFTGKHERFIQASCLTRRPNLHGLAWREVADNENERKVIAAPIEFLAGHAHTLWTAWFQSGQDRDLSVAWLNALIFDYSYRLRGVSRHVLKATIAASPWWSSEEREDLLGFLPSFPDGAAEWDARLGRHMDLTVEEFRHVLTSFDLANRRNPTFTSSRMDSFLRHA